MSSSEFYWYAFYLKIIFTSLGESTLCFNIIILTRSYLTPVCMTVDTIPLLNAFLFHSYKSNFMSRTKTNIFWFNYAAYEFKHRGYFGLPIIEATSKLLL